MKIRIADRVLVALAGLVLLTVCGAVLAQVFFDAKIIDTAGVLGAALGNYLGPSLDRELLKKALGILFLLTGLRELRYRDPQK